MKEGRAARRRAAKAVGKVLVDAAADAPAATVAGRSAQDGLINLVARVGLGAGNQISEGEYRRVVKFTRAGLDAMYRTSWVVARVVDAVAKDMVRAGIEIQGAANPGDAKKLTTALTRLGVWRSYLNGVRWGRLYGGAIGFLVVHGQDPSTPLDVRTVARGQFRGLRVYDRYQLSPEMDGLVGEGPNAGCPRFYRVTAGTDLRGSGLVIHHSRAIRFLGAELPVWQSLGEEWWGASVVERGYDRLLAFDTGTMGAANLLTRAHLRTVGVDRLRDILAAGNDAEKALIQTFALMGHLQSTEGITLIDKEDSFATHSYTFAGLDDILLAFGQQLAGAWGIPLVKLFGQAPKGLNATGDADLRLYYDDVSAAQENDLRDGLDTLLALVHRSVLGFDRPDGFEFTFAPLWQMSATEKAAHATAITNAMVAANGAGIVGRARAMEELRAASDENGVFASITDEEIEQAKLEEAPVPPDLGGGGEGAAALATIEAFNAGVPLPSSTAGDPLAAVQAFATGAAPVEPEAEGADDDAPDPGMPPAPGPSAGDPPAPAADPLEVVRAFGAGEQDAVAPKAPGLLERIVAWVRGR